MLVFSFCDAVSVKPACDQHTVRLCEGPSRAASGTALRRRWQQQLNLQLCSNDLVLIKRAGNTSNVEYSMLSLLRNLVRGV